MRCSCARGTLDLCSSGDFRRSLSHSLVSSFRQIFFARCKAECYYCGQPWNKPFGGSTFGFVLMRKQSAAWVGGVLLTVTAIASGQTFQALHHFLDAETSESVGRLV